MCILSTRGQRRPGSDCAIAQSDQGLRYPLPESLDAIECFRGEQRPGWDLAYEHDDINPHSLHILEGPFSLGADHKKRYITKYVHPLKSITSNCHDTEAIRTWWEGVLWISTVCDNPFYGSRHSGDETNIKCTLKNGAVDISFYASFKTMDTCVFLPIMNLLSCWTTIKKTRNTW